MEHVRCLLPGGFVDEAGLVHRQVELAPLRGREEEFLASQHGLESNALTTALLSRCVQRIGAITPVSETVTRNLLVADRQYLLLKLREATFGHRVQATIVCPDPACGTKMDIDFSTQDIPVKASEDKGPLYQMQLPPESGLMSEDGEICTEVVFRLPNGGDQEAISPLLLQDESQAGMALLERCVQCIGPWENPGLARIGQLSPQVLMAIEQQIELVAPAVELTMAGNCPECDLVFSLPFDLSGFFWSELRTSRNLLLREVHFLAFHYHWSEREIMAMPRDKRRSYIEILAEELERFNDGI